MGIAVDAVVSDFIAGAAEQLSSRAMSGGGHDLLGRGVRALWSTRAYSGVTLGLIHGSVPHLYVLCHMAGTTEVEGVSWHLLPPLPELIELHERLALPARLAKASPAASR